MREHSVGRLEHEDEKDAGMKEQDVQAVAHGSQIKVNPDRLTHASCLFQEDLAGVVEVDHLLGGQRSRSVHHQAGQTSDFRVGRFRERTSGSYVGGQVAVDLVDVGLDVGEPEVDQVLLGVGGLPRVLGRGGEQGGGQEQVLDDAAQAGEGDGHSK